MPEAIIKKDGTDYPLQTMPLHYPADRVYLDGDTTNTTQNPKFTEASTRANISSGESFATILGKIKKFFTDLKTVAFTGSYSDLSNKPIYRDYSITTTPNGYVSPFSALGTEDITLSGYKPISSTIIGGSGDIGVALLNSNDRYVYAMTSSALTVTVRVVYMHT